MAKYPSNFQGKEFLQPGARGEVFQADLPGYRGNEDRINRTNNNLTVGRHDVPYVKYCLDDRLPVLFRYGYAYGYNQIVVPKGRIMAVDPTLSLYDTDEKKAYNALTLANGGTAVKLQGKKWEPVINAEKTGTDTHKYYCAVGNNNLSVDAETGRVTSEDVVRLANIPIGLMERNEYSRDKFAMNGMTPSPVLTDALVEVPFFTEQAKAELNPWGSAYGNLRAGDLVKSDANGRFVISPLSRIDQLTLTAQEIEKERQQVVGQVYHVSRDLVPFGSAKYARWAMSDLLKFEEFNPTMWPETGRRGEDVVSKYPFEPNHTSAINSEKNIPAGKDPFEPLGYPYDQTMTQHDLHMLESSARTSDLRMPMEHKLDYGIPGLTDGHNVAIRDVGPEKILEVNKCVNPQALFTGKTSEVDIADGTLEILVTDKTASEIGSVPEDKWSKVAKDNTAVNMFVSDEKKENLMECTYVNELQGFFCLKVKDVSQYNQLFEDGAKDLNVYVKYKKRGCAGVPTMLDWDGCVGVATILLQK